jgi:hypothetical protein
MRLNVTVTTEAIATAQVELPAGRQWSEVTASSVSWNTLILKFSDGSSTKLDLDLAFDRLYESKEPHAHCIEGSDGDALVEA